MSAVIAADPGNHCKRCRRRLDQKTDADQHVNAGRHHRRRMDQRGDRRRAFHRIRQPDVQRKLRGLADRAAKNEKRGGRRDSQDYSVNFAISGAMSANTNEPVAVQTIRIPSMNPKSPMRLVMNAFFAASAADALEPMADQQIGTDADQLPEDEHHHEIVREHDSEHREHEEREPGEIARLALVLAHVA